MNPPRKQVTIYTDGGCDPNPGPGGYAAVLLYSGRRKELWGGFRHTTNNRMELYAAIRALEALKEPCQVTLYSDSAYLVRAMQEGWAQRWRAQGWKRTRKEVAQNADLWQRLLDLCAVHEVSFVWLRGHADDPENNRCDALVRQARRSPHLPPDEEYEKSLAAGENRPPTLL